MLGSGLLGTIPSVLTGEESFSLLPSMAASRVTPTAVAAAPTTNRLANHAPMAFTPAMTVGAINGTTAIASPVGSVYLIGLLPRSYRWTSPP